MRYLNYIFSFIIVIIFSACSQKDIEIGDLKNYSQKPNDYTKQLKVKLENQNKLSKEFLKNYFSPWDLQKLSDTKEKASWGNYYAKKEIYLENHKLASKEWFRKQIDNSNFKNYNTILKKAISIKNANIRVFPNTSRLFYTPKKAGEGFPFDYNQNSLLKINTPLLVSHYSKDKAWAFVQAHFVSGWIRVDKLKIVDDKFIQEFKTGNYVVSIKEAHPIFNKSFIEYAKVGTIFPKKEIYYLLASKNGIEKIKLDKQYISSFPINFTPRNVELLSNEFIGELYGWGGLNGHRDCSSFTQDFFTPFGIYLKRNSKAQTELHKYIDLSKMSDEEKKVYIKKYAKPFLTLVYLKGHIMLYIGIKNNEPMVMHNVWGVKTWEFPFTQGRNIIGKTAITTLEPGIELNNIDKNKTILKRVKGLVFLNQVKID